MAMTTSTQIPAAVQTFYDRVLLERATPFLAYQMFGQKRPVPLNSGDQPRFRRYSSLTQATAPLVEGVTPSSQQLAKTDITGQLVQYGSYVEITDYVQYTSEDKVLTEVAELLGENAGESIDSIVRDSIIGGSSVLRVGSVARGSIALKPTKADLDKIIRALRTSNAKFWTENPIMGTDKVGTTPIAPAYFAVIHPYVTYDLAAILTTDFIPVHKYPNPSVALPGEVGSYSHIRFIESTNAKVFVDQGGSAVAASLKYTTANSACDVYTMLVFGKNAFGITELSGKGLENIVKGLGSGDDPLNQRSTSGWRATLDAVILNDAFMYRYEFGVSA